MSKKITALALCVILSSTAFAATPPKHDSKMKPQYTDDWYYVYNDTNHMLKLRVGNWFPTPYTISPHSYAYVHQTTKHQDIHIEKVY